MRPRTLDEVVGHASIVGPNSPLRRLVATGQLRPIILWGPPGTGKTTLARLLASETSAPFVALSAVTATLRDARPVLEEARQRYRARRTATVLFLDEIHRFNKAQQDAFLPYMEEGSVVLIGATTENPAFSLNSALLSRTRVIVLQRLTTEDLQLLCRQALADPVRGLGSLRLQAQPEAIEAIARLADGDARRALGILEAAALLTQAHPANSGQDSQTIRTDEVTAAAQAPVLLHDRDGDQHYDLLSALHKSLRASDPDAAVYYATRLLAGGEDPLVVLRRMIRMASEDIGLMDDRALPLVIAARDAYVQLGPPEGHLAIIHAAARLAIAPKSDAVYRAHKAALDAIEQTGSLPVPNHLRNAPTALAKSLGHGEGYHNPHNGPQPAGQAPPSNLPPPLQGRQFVPRTMKPPS
jgi:putative ATPase